MRLALAPVLIALTACARKPPADVGAPLEEAAGSAAAAPAPELPSWLREVLPALRAQDWRAADAVLTAALARDDLPQQERTLALWYRASARAQSGDRAGELADLRSFVSASRLLDLRGDAPGAMLQHRVSLAQLAVAAEDAAQDPGIAASPERSISVLLASDEYFFLGRLSCGPGGAAGYSVVQQTLINDDRGVFDLLEVRCDADGTSRQLWFDLEIWWQLLGFSLGANPPPDGFDADGARALLQLATE